MKFYELILTCYLKRNVYFTECNEMISKNINKAMLLDKDLSNKHKEKGYKFYCFNSFYPVEKKDKIYKAGRIYVFKIRSLDKQVIDKLKKVMLKNKSDDINVIASELKTINKRHIVELYTFTPAVITTKGNYNWIPGDDFNLLMNRLHSNLEKKYKYFYGEKIETSQNFIQHLEILNHKPFSFKYKNTKLLGNKFKIIVNDDEVSQKLAFIAAATGIGEKSSSVGMGFCDYQFLK